MNQIGKGPRSWKGKVRYLSGRQEISSSHQVDGEIDVSFEIGCEGGAWERCVPYRHQVYCEKKEYLVKRKEGPQRALTCFKQAR